VLPVLALSLALAGCGGDDEIEPKMPDSSSAASTSTAESPSPSEPVEPVEPVEPTLPSEAEGDDAAAAEAFVRHYYDYVNYAQATGDTKGLRRLALPSCAPCEGGASTIEQIYRSGGTIEDGEHSVRHSRAEKGGGAADVRSYFVQVKVHNTEQLVRGAQSDLDGAYPAATLKLVFHVLHDRGWRIAGWKSRE
jgi:hypothetical protein